ncbi:MAG: Uma2 family endonuclease [Bacteroidota bacterium]
MKANIDNQILATILDSPMAPVLLHRIQSVLDKEKERRELFYNEITEQEKAEFINGEIIIHSPVKKKHTDISLNLVQIIRAYVFEKDLGFIGFEKTLIQCTRNDYEPDICFFEKAISKDFKTDQALFPIPNFIVGILSPGTEKRERGIKFDDYQNHGVKEYWIIDPQAQTVEQFLLNQEGVFELNVKSDSGDLKSIQIPHLVIPIPVIFDEKLAHDFVKKIYQA